MYRKLKKIFSADFLRHELNSLKTQTQSMPFHSGFEVLNFLFLTTLNFCFHFSFCTAPLVFFCIRGAVLRGVN